MAGHAASAPVPSAVRSAVQCPAPRGCQTEAEKRSCGSSRCPARNGRRPAQRRASEGHSDQCMHGNEEHWSGEAVKREENSHRVERPVGVEGDHPQERCGRSDLSDVQDVPHLQSKSRTGSGKKKAHSAGLGTRLKPGSSRGRWVQQRRFREQRAPRRSWAGRGGAWRARRRRRTPAEKGEDPHRRVYQSSATRTDCGPSGP